MTQSYSSWTNQVCVCVCLLRCLGSCLHLLSVLKPRFPECLLGSCWHVLGPLNDEKRPQGSAVLSVCVHVCVHVSMHSSIKRWQTSRVPLHVNPLDRNFHSSCLLPWCVSWDPVTDLLHPKTRSTKRSGLYTEPELLTRHTHKHAPDVITHAGLIECTNSIRVIVVFF